MNITNKQIPFISVIIPMRNEEKYIQKCIESFINQDYPKNYFEIIVVDGSSEDRSSEIVTELIKSHINIQLIENKKKITPVALNIGIKQAMGDIIIIFSFQCDIRVEYIILCCKRTCDNYY